MKSNKKKHVVIWGIIVAIFTVISLWYTINFNEARFVAPMDLSTYSFRMQDLPMIITGFLVMTYILCLVIMMIQATFEIRKTNNTKNISRKIKPQLGFLGLLGFFGFLGFLTYNIDKTIFPFIFFIFFGFFGFFYEGKMSNTFMDERYKENKIKAHFIANKTALAIIFVATIIFGQGKLVGNLEYTFIAYIIVISFAIALELFLSEFLLYHYDHDDPVDEREE